jgi:hypothetical protein
MPRLVRLLFPLFALAILTPSACAHALGMECRIQGARVVVNAFYDDDSPAVRARVHVLDGDKEIGNGSTDEQGSWSFARPAPGQYTVEVDAGAGHRKNESITVPAAVAPANVQAIGNGPTRQEFTRFPWDRLLLGLLAIFGLAGAFLLVAAFRKGLANGAQKGAAEK